MGDQKEMCNTTNNIEEYQTAEEVMMGGEARRDTDITRAKRWIKKQNIKKSGYNKSLQYKYFEFDDIIGVIQEACERYDLSTHFTTEYISTEPVPRPATQRNETNNMPTYTGMGLLEIKSIHYHEPRQVRIPLTFMMQHQDIGKAVQYCKRYAYMIGFEIGEPDMVDATITSNDNNKQAPTNTRVNKHENKTRREWTPPRQWTSQEKNESHKENHNSVDDTWKNNDKVKSLHKLMREKFPNAFTTKENTLYYGEKFLAEGIISQEDYKVIKDTIVPQKPG